MQVRKTPYVAEWEDKRRQEILELTSNGRIPHEAELEKHPEKSLEGRMCEFLSQGSSLADGTNTHALICVGLMGQVAGAINVRFFIYTDASHERIG